jgi:hypothetical protein
MMLLTDVPQAEHRNLHTFLDLITIPDIDTTTQVYYPSKNKIWCQWSFYTTAE